MKARSRKDCPLVSLTPFLLFLAVLASCQGSPGITGRYEAANIQDEKSPFVLIFKSDGKGTWKIRDEEASFTWEAKGSSIRLHTKSGGVITGQIEEDRNIDITIPGSGRYRFKKKERANRES